MIKEFKKTIFHLITLKLVLFLLLTFSFTILIYSLIKEYDFQKVITSLLPLLLIFILDLAIFFDLKHLFWIITHYKKQPQKAKKYLLNKIKHTEQMEDHYQSIYKVRKTNGMFTKHLYYNALYYLDQIK